MKRYLFILIVVLCLAGALFAGYQIFDILSEYQAGEESYDSFQQYVITPTAALQKSEDRSEPDMAETLPDEDVPAETDAVPEATEDPTCFPIVDFDALAEVNEDIVAWVYIEGTNINYPVVQGENNQEYLSQMVDGSQNAAGSIFMDYRNDVDFSDQNTILYGHNMNNGTMFAGIRNYRTQSYYEAHPDVLIVTPEGNYRYEIVSGYVAKLTDGAWQVEFSDEASFQTWIQDTISRSGFVSRVIPEKDDVFLTLSTCSYEFRHARFVLVAVLKK